MHHGHMRCLLNSGSCQEQSSNACRALCVSEACLDASTAIVMTAWHIRELDCRKHSLLPF